MRKRIVAFAGGVRALADQRALSAAMASSGGDPRRQRLSSSQARFGGYRLTAWKASRLTRSIWAEQAFGLTAHDRLDLLLLAGGRRPLPLVAILAISSRKRLSFAWPPL